MRAFFEVLASLAAGAAVGAAMVYAGYDPKEAFTGGMTAAVVVWFVT